MQRKGQRSADAVKPEGCAGRRASPARWPTVVPVARSGSRDGGVARRVLGYLLTWLAERKAWGVRRARERCMPAAGCPPAHAANVAAERKSCVRVRGSARAKTPRRWRWRGGTLGADADGPAHAFQSVDQSGDRSGAGQGRQPAGDAALERRSTPRQSLPGPAPRGRGKACRSRTGARSDAATHRTHYATSTNPTFDHHVGADPRDSAGMPWRFGQGTIARWHGIAAWRVGHPPGIPACGPPGPVRANGAGGDRGPATA